MIRVCDNTASIDGNLDTISAEFLVVVGMMHKALSEICPDKPHGEIDTIIYNLVSYGINYDLGNNLKVFPT
ncbi:MAG: hypothetical protein IKK08_03005 [Clostridia bacterium]|nr:hypothetical protein [Clostridia bacterium]